MAKEDVVAKGMEDMAQAQKDFLGAYYDKVVADQPAAPGVPVQQVPTGDDTAMAQALKDANAQIADLKSQLDAMTLKDKDAEDKMAKFNEGLDSLQAMFQTVAKPAPVEQPAPTPEQAPAKDESAPAQDAPAPQNP